MPKLPAVGIIPVLLLSHASLAQSSFDMTDRDNDGTVSKDEFYQTVGQAQVFETLDTNADNRLSLQELEVIEGEGVLLEWNLQQGESLGRREFYNGLYNHIDDDADGTINTFDWKDPADDGWFGVFETP